MITENIKWILFATIGDLEIHRGGVWTNEEGRTEVYSFRNRCRPHDDKTILTKGEVIALSHVLSVITT